MTLVGAIAVVALGIAVALPGCDARRRFARYDTLAAARCEAGCWGMHGKSACVKTCLTKEVSKPGYCPSKTMVATPDGVCEEKCNGDSNCRGVEKCCSHNCGFTCQMPTELDTIDGLPGIPQDPVVIEGRKRRTVRIDWTMAESSRQYMWGGVVLYLIEERNHAGKYFMESMMGNWSLCSKSIWPRRTMRNVVKPGKWYQFRVAAVNQNGTRGFSESTLPFTIKTNPHPPKAPENVTVSPLTRINGSLYAEMRWSPSVSDLPIHKYKVFWSRRLYGDKALDSVLVHQRVIPGNFHSGMWMQYSSEWWTEAVDMESAIRRISCELSDLSWNALHSANYDMDIYFDPEEVQRVMDLSDRYDFGVGLCNKYSYGAISLGEYCKQMIEAKLNDFLSALIPYLPNDIIEKHQLRRKNISSDGGEKSTEGDKKD